MDPVAQRNLYLLKTQEQREMAAELAEAEAEQAEFQELMNDLRTEHGIGSPGPDLVGEELAEVKRLFGLAISGRGPTYGPEREAAVREVVIMDDAGVKEFPSSSDGSDFLGSENSPKSTKGFAPARPAKRKASSSNDPDFLRSRSLLGSTKSSAPAKMAKRGDDTDEEESTSSGSGSEFLGSRDLPIFTKDFAPARLAHRDAHQS